MVNMNMGWELPGNLTASVQVRDGEGATPLHRAVEFNHQEAAQMLLDRGCPLDVSDTSAGDTVLHWAVRNGNNELLAVLLRKGANPDLVNKVRKSWNRMSQ